MSFDAPPTVVRDMMTQCSLERCGTRIVSWLPAKFAKLGKVLKLKNSAGNWDDGFLVKGVYATESRNVVAKMSVAHNKHRKHTDI